MTLKKTDPKAGGGLEGGQQIGGGTVGSTQSLRSGRVFAAAKIANVALQKAIRKPLASGSAAAKSDLAAIIGD